MDPHFRAFSFVDRITALEPGRHIVGQYSIPAPLPSFSNSLVSEAVGQLAAWAAMAAVHFTIRPVAGIVGRAEMRDSVLPGKTLDLTAEIESIDQEAVAYAGTASVDGSTVLQLERCVGPMMPVTDFDDPHRVKQRFDLLCGQGAPAGAFAGLPQFPLESQTMTSEGSIRASFRVPEQAEFFSDHFPRRPVFPGTLLIQAGLEVAVGLLDSISPSPADTRWVPTVISDVKLRSFVPPGELLDLEARRDASPPGSAGVVLQIRRRDRRIGSLRVDLNQESPG